MKYEEKGHCDFVYIINAPERVIALIDLDLGKSSLTNFLDSALSIVFSKENEDIVDYTIIYRDSEGTWDLVLPHFDHKRAIVGSSIQSIGAKEYEKAIQLSKRARL
jgi:hypothetical protein